MLPRDRRRPTRRNEGSSRSPMATGSPRTPGRRFCAISATGACALRCSPSATARSASGRRFARSSPRREQRCWVHKCANTLDALPKSIQPLAKKMLAEIRDAEDRDHALAAAKAFDGEFRTKWPKAADKIRDDLDQLLTFFDFPAEHWVHLKTSNIIESTFATVRLRTKVTKGPGSRAAGLAMAFKLIESAQDR